MKVKHLCELLEECKREGSSYNKSQFFPQPQDDQYMQLLQQFVDTRCAELLGQYDNDANRVLEQDVTFNKFKNYLRNCKQLESFESYLTEQSNLFYKDQELLYRLIMGWQLKELPPEILIEIFRNLPLQDLLQTRLTCDFFKRISDSVIASRYPNAHVEYWRESLIQVVVHNETVLKGYDESLRIHPNDADTLRSRGFVLYKLGHYKEALQNYNESLKFRPNHAYALHGRGIVLHVLGRNEEALQSIDESLKIYPNDAAMLYNRGLVLRKLDRDEEALQSFNESLKFR